MTDSTIQLPPNGGGPILDAEQFTNSGSTVTNRERMAVVPGIPQTGQTTPVNANQSASGDTTVVAGTAAQTVRIYRLVLSVSAPTNILFKDGASTTLAGPYYLQAGGTITLDDSGEPWFITSAGNGFVVNSSNAVAYTVTAWYTKS